MQTRPNTPLPLGAQLQDNGINFSLFSRHATSVSLLLFDKATDAVSSRSILLDIEQNKTGDIWHIWIEDLRPGCLYAWQVDGPDEPAQGHRFNSQKILLDPYAVALAGTECWNFGRLCDGEPSGDLTQTDADAMAKCLVPACNFDWQGVQAPRLAWADTIIYETHVRGLTVDPSSAVSHAGTFRGLTEKLPYLKELGITAIELLPIQDFFENELTVRNPATGEQLRNYWGYSTVAFFAPKEHYACGGTPGSQINEFKTMVRECHRIGIEVILDIVFNHTAEGNHLGPTINFKGLDNPIYYLLEADLRYYKNYSGTGNTLNCNHPVVRDYILDCLRYWVIEMQVDGFRFDLASVLGRDRQGNLLANPPLLERIAEDPILRDIKLIAEAWDAAGAYQVGSFMGRRWSEWNGRYRDDVRRFWRGDGGMTGALASRLAGSADIYEYGGKVPAHSINFITSHDGFTLNDLVSYAQKHNEANGENNRDGTNDDYSANNGVEGPSDDPAIEALRLRQIKNMIATLMLSRGVPMLLGGDEFRRSQAGNNNAYCQDNAVSWYDWTLLEKNTELFQFVRSIIALRRQFPVLSEERFYSAQEIQWFGPNLSTPDWNGGNGLLACMINANKESGERLYLLFNATVDTVTFVLPTLPSGQIWRLFQDTSQPMVGDTDTDTVSPETKRPVQQATITIGNYALRDHALAILSTADVTR